MASVSVVGRHRLNSEPQLFPFSLTSVRKKIAPLRKSSKEKMMVSRRGSGSDAECGSDSTRREAATQRVPPGPAAEAEAAANGKTMPGDRCAAPAVSAAPRSPHGDREAGSADCDRSTGTGIPESRGGHATRDCNSNNNCDPNHNSGVRRGSSSRRSDANAVAGEPLANGHRGAHRHRDAPHGRRDSRNGDSRVQSICSAVSAQGETGGPPLQRVTQGRTGVVKLARTEPTRREAWSIFPQEVDPRVRTERGEGHRFEPRPVKQDWCDVCSRQMNVQALKCQNCSYTCHLECKSQVQLDCNQRDRTREETPSPSSHCSYTANQHKQIEAKEEDEGGTRQLSEKEVQVKIEEYNAQVSENGMKLASDGSYTGFIKVHLRLSRPVTVGSESAIKQTGGGSQVPEDQDRTDCGQSEIGTSFYLPSDCVKQVHISSLTTTREVIQGLLKKFLVLDNPRKFALYRLTHRDGQDLFQKLPLCERPLLLRLIAGPDPEKLSFVLKENETGEVEWHAFSVPELQNFIVILEKEEMERVRAVQQKYAVYRKKLEQALQKHDP